MTPTMKKRMIGMMVLMACNCGKIEDEGRQARERAREQILKGSVRDRDKAENENRRLHLENNRMTLEVSRMEGRVMVLEAEADKARSDVENAWKMGRAKAHLEFMEIH